MDYIVLYVWQDLVFSVKLHSSKTLVPIGIKTSVRHSSAKLHNLSGWKPDNLVLIQNQTNISGGSLRQLYWRVDAVML